MNKEPGVLFEYHYNDVLEVVLVRDLEDGAEEGVKIVIRPEAWTRLTDGEDIVDCTEIPV